jgi:hypothetical protein
MRDVHNQLCIVKRQKTMAAQVAAPKPAAASTAAKTPPPAATATPPAAAIPSPAATVAAPAAGGGSVGQTTISLSGTGTSYSKAEGPIDAKFKEKRQVAGTYQGIKVWGPMAIRHLTKRLS